MASHLVEPKDFEGLLSAISYFRPHDRELRLRVFHYALENANANLDWLSSTMRKMFSAYRYPEPFLSFDHHNATARINKNPKDPDSWEFAGDYLYAQLQYEDSAAWELRHVLSRNPDDEESAHAAQQLRERSGGLRKEAQKMYQHALDLCERGVDSYRVGARKEQIERLEERLRHLF